MLVITYQKKWTFGLFFLNFITFAEIQDRMEQK